MDQKFKIYGTLTNKQNGTKWIITKERTLIWVLSSVYDKNRILPVLKEDLSKHFSFDNPAVKALFGS